MFPVLFTGTFNTISNKRTDNINGEQAHTYRDIIAEEEATEDDIDIETYYADEEINIVEGFVEYVHSPDSTVTKVLNYED